MLGKPVEHRGGLAAHPLLVLDTSFVSRRTFDATCRLAGIEANIVFESRTPHTLLAMAEQRPRHRGRAVGCAYRSVRAAHGRRDVQGEPLREPLAVFWDKRRPLPPYATAFCNMLAEYVREVFPISRPSESERGATVPRAVARKRASAEPR